MDVLLMAVKVVGSTAVPGSSEVAAIASTDGKVVSIKAQAGTRYQLVDRSGREQVVQKLVRRGKALEVHADDRVSSRITPTSGLGRAVVLRALRAGRASPGLG